jgi:hypothetical protein
MKLLHFALVSLLLCLPAQAQEIEYGKGLICDTRQQAERLVRHLYRFQSRMNRGDP